MVVDTVILHRVTVVAAMELGAEGISVLVWDLLAYFYTDERQFTLYQPERLQRAFDFLAELFNWVRLWTNMWKTVIMDCEPCHMHGIM